MNENWESYPSNIRLVTKEGRILPYSCGICFAEATEEDSQYYGPKTKSWYCSKHWQENWKQELDIKEEKNEPRE